MEHTQDRSREYTLEEGVLRGVMPDAANFYKASPARVLALFVAAAARNCAIESDTYKAAAAAIDGVKKVQAPVVRSALQNILLSSRPQALAPLVAQGALTPFGILKGTPELGILAKVPCTMETRWWCFLRLCNSHYSTVCERLGFSSVFAATLAAMDKLAEMQTLPDNEYDLKMMLSAMPEFDYGAAVRTLQLKDERWAGQAELFDRLYRSGDPYRVGDLAITTGQLAVLGIRDKKAAWVVRQLLDTVIKTPELNQYPPLEMMALTLAQQYQ